MLAIWLIGIIVLGLWCSYRYGQIKSSYERSEVVAPMMAGVILWPMVIAGLILIAPFYGMAKLGQRSLDKKDK
jgi:hypothetical protein